MEALRARSGPPRGWLLTVDAGRGMVAHGRDLTLAERWNGGRWTIQPTPRPTSTRGIELIELIELTGVSCPSSTPNGWPWPSSAACTAVGSYARYSSGDYGPLAERR